MWSRHFPFATPKAARYGHAMADTVSFGFEDVPRAEKTARVGGVFSSVAENYDRMNDLMSGGLHRLWKDRFVRRVRPRQGEAILDMAGGTGDIAFRLARAGASVTAADINPEMLSVGMERAAERGVTEVVWREENAESLSFADRSFDAYTIAFGVRNVTDIPAALEEAHRVLRYGGRFYCLEFSTVEWPSFKQLYDAYSLNVLPKIGRVVADDEDAYRYLAESIRRFPPMPEFERMVRAAGFTATKVEPIGGGLVAIHSGWKA